MGIGTIGKFFNVATATMAEHQQELQDPLLAAATSPETTLDDQLILAMPHFLGLPSRSKEETGAMFARIEARKANTTNMNDKDEDKDIPAIDSGKKEELPTLDPP